MSEQGERKPGIGTIQWFKPLYRRIILVGIVAAWCAWEWLHNQDQLWGMLTLAALAYAVWSFFINFDNELKKAEERDAKR